MVKLECRCVNILLQWRLVERRMRWDIMYECRVQKMARLDLPHDSLEIALGR